MSKGEYKVGINFNPSGDKKVSKIKSWAASLIDLIDAIPTPEKAVGIIPTEKQSIHTTEVWRLKGLAITAIEEGAMWAVKAATKREPDDG